MTTIGIQFYINDLNASYEVVGSSDNYSFQYNLGRGSELLAGRSGSLFKKSIDLYGNYGEFTIRVFAVNDIGIRSEFVEDTISISPPSFKSSFFFNNFRLTQDEVEIENIINQSPTEDDNLLSVNSKYLGRSFYLSWELIPPQGHPKDSRSMSEELLNDGLFDHFEIKIYNGEDRVLLEEDTINSSSSLKNLFNTAEPFSLLDNYRSFSLFIDEPSFNDLNLDRTFYVEITCRDSLGKSSQAIIQCVNNKPIIRNFTSFSSGLKVNFNWIEDDDDFDKVKIDELVLSEEKEIIYPNSLLDNYNHYDKISKASLYARIKGSVYEAGKYFLLEDGNVYKCLQTHVYSENVEPGNENYWENMGTRSAVEYNTYYAKDEVFSSFMRWGKSYFYQIQPFDKYGEGDVYNLTEDGIQLNSEPDELAGFGLSLKIDNLTFRERGEDLIFDWDVVDGQGNVVDINQYKFLYDVGDQPSVLGLKAWLFDYHTNIPVFEITDGDHSVSKVFNQDGGSSVVAGLPSTKVFNHFEYTREINNAIYGSNGLPENVTNFDPQAYYDENSNVYISGLRRVYEPVIYNGYQDKTIRPYYPTWKDTNSIEKQSDPKLSVIVDYQGSLYCAKESFGPELTGENTNPKFRGFIDQDEVYSVGDIVFAPIDSYSFFNETGVYKIGDRVIFDGNIFESNLDQYPNRESGDEVIYSGNLEYPDESENNWRELDKLSQVECAQFEALQDLSLGNNLPPAKNSDWLRLNPHNAVDYFDLYAEPYPLQIKEWSPLVNFYKGQYAIYDNDIWVASQNNGINFSVETPSDSSAFWSNQINGADIFTDHLEGDIVYHNSVVYKCMSDNPTGGPLEALVTGNRDSISNYADCQWQPYWQRNKIFDEYIWGHIGIPQSGKRSIGLALSLLDTNLNSISNNSIIADNPPPAILQSSFQVDSLSEASKVKFKFNYALDFQEKTTKVNLYRSSNPIFEITDDAGLPFTSASQENSTLVQVFLGAADASFGDNINELIDSPPLYIDEDGLEYPTGYYYKILPYDDFGSGVLYNVSNNAGDLEQVIVYPKRFNNPNPNVVPGRVLRSDPDVAEGFVPGPVQNLSIQTSFESFYIDWFMPDTEFEEGSSKLLKQVPNDIDHYEVWMGDEQELKISSGGQADVLWEAINNTGYRKIEGVIYSVGEIPYEVTDPALEVSNAENILNVSANGLSTEVVYPGETNVTKYFWVRPVDTAGNKGPFTGASPSAYSLNDEGVLGMQSIPGQAKTTDIADFEQNITQTFPNTVALVPNNPFSNNYSVSEGQAKAGTVSWMEHFVYYNGNGYLIHEGETEDAYIYWSATGQTPTHSFTVRDITQEELDAKGLGVKGGGALDSTISNPLRNLKYVAEYDTSSWHPAGQGYSTENSASANNDGSAGDPYNNNQYPSLMGETDDFIIAKNAGGIATTMWHAFANATIGTAHIDDAAITSAKVHTLTADKIRSAEIRSQDIQIGGQGQIRNAGFLGLDAKNPTNPEEQQEGFAVSGDGSFVFQSKDGKLFFDGDSLTLFGKLRQYDGTEYTFTDLTAEPASFFYVEQSDGTYIPANRTQTCDLTAAFQNSYIEPNEVRWTVTRPNGDPFFTYDEFFDSYNEEEGRYSLSGFHYDPDDFYGGDIDDQRGPGVARIAKAVLDVTGFERMVRFDDDGNATSILPQDTSVIISVSGVNTSMQRTIAIDFVADGASAVYVDLNTENQIFKYDYDGDYDDELKTLQLNAQAYNTFGEVRYDFYTGANLANLTDLRTNSDWSLDNGIAILNNLDQAIPTVNFTPFVARVAVIHENINVNGVDEDLLLATDFLTIYGSQPGKDSYTVLLDNENHTYIADEYARVPDSELSRGSTIVEFKRGQDLYNFVPFDQERFDDQSFNYPLRSFTIKDSIQKATFSDDSSVTFKIEKINAAGEVVWTNGESVLDSHITSYGKARVTLTSIPDAMREESFLVIPVDDCKYVKNAINSDFPPVQFEKSYTFSKTIEGKKGRKIDLSVTDQTIEYDTIGNNPTPSVVTISVAAYNFHNSVPKFIFYEGSAGNFEQVSPAGEVNEGVPGATTTYNFTPPSSFYNTDIPKIIKCEAYDTQEGSSNYELVATDQITVFGLKNGSNAISIVQSQESSLIAVSDAGGDVFSLDFENTENTISVFEGTNEFTYDENLSSNSTFKITASVPAGSPITFSQDSTNKNKFIVTAWNDLTESRSSINFLVETKDSDGQTRSFNRTQAISTSKSGVSPRAVKLSAAKQGVSYSSKDHTTTIANDSITLTAEPKNTVGTSIFYKYITTDGSTLKVGDNDYDGGWTSSDTVVYTPPSVYPGSDDNILSTITCLYTEQNSATAITMAQDSVTIFALKAGTDALTIILSNETHAIPWDTNNLADLSGSNTNIEVFQGADKLMPVAYGAGAGQADSYGDLSNGEFYVTTNLSEAIEHEAGDITIDSTNKILQFPDLKTFDTTSLAAERSFTIYAKNFEPTPVTASVTRSQTFSIAKSSPPVRDVRIEVDKQGISYSALTNNLTTNNEQVSVTANAQNQFGSNVRYKFSLDGSGLLYIGSTNKNKDTGWVSNTSIIYKPPSSFSGSNILGTITCQLSEDGGSTTLVQDSVSIFCLKEGSDAITVTLSNEVHNLAWDGLSANPDYTGSSTQLVVYEGSTQLTPKNVTSSGNLSNGEFFVSASGTNITKGGATISGNTITFGDVSAFVFTGNNRSAYINFTVQIKRNNGSLVTTSKKQNFSINEKGDVGGFPAYRGTWNSTTQYYGSTLSSKRADIALYGSEYYIALRDNKNARPDTSTSDWQAFGASFSNVATSFLMVDNSTVKNTITLADGTAAGNIGRMQTYGFDGDGSPQGFRVGLNAGTLEFYAGTSSSYVKFDNSQLEKIRIRDAYIANSTIVSADSISGGAISGSSITGTGAISGASLSTGTGSISGGAISGSTITGTGAISGASLSTGTGSISGGAISGSTITGTGAISGSTITGSGAISGASLSTGTGSISGGAISGSTITGTGAISGASLSVTGDVTAYSGSDKRLKDNISNISNALDKLIKLSAVEFTWNDKQSFFKGNDVGLIAQEVQELGFNIVKERPDGYLGLRYEKIIPFLVAAIKEQQEVIEEMKSKIDSLESKINY